MLIEKKNIFIHSKKIITKTLYSYSVFTLSYTNSLYDKRLLFLYYMEIFSNPRWPLLFENKYYDSQLTVIYEIKLV